MANILGGFSFHVYIHNKSFTGEKDLVLLTNVQNIQVLTSLSIKLKIALFELLIVSVLRKHNEKMDFESDHEDDGTAVNKRYKFKENVSY